MVCWILAAWRAPHVLVGTVSSRRLTDEPSIRTTSGLARVVLMLVGIVAGGESEALNVAISAYSWTVLDSSSRTLE